MRKVLLATTALVAMNVSVAQAADITISGALETEYRSTDASDTFYTDGNIVFQATATSDTGLTYSVTQSQHIQQAQRPQVTLLTIAVILVTCTSAMLMMTLPACLTARLVKTMISRVNCITVPAK